MANKRSLKRAIKNVCADIATECLIAAQYVKGVEPEKMDTVIQKLADLQSNALSTISFGFDKIPSDFATRKDYKYAKAAYFKKAYKSFKQKFGSHINEIVKEMNEILPTEVKQANIEASKK
ncbi:MAG: hypothetical protein HDS68_05345 [Bacteroidales bacterium]|nr:hypothetical protein [Bacteroidales bacterium]